MDTRETEIRQLADDIDELVARARRYRLETVVYVLETAKIETLRATKPQPPASQGIGGSSLCRPS